MLKIYFGSMDEVVYDTPTYFDNTYLDSWITDDFGQEVIKHVDKSSRFKFTGRR